MAERARLFAPEGYLMPPGRNGCPTTDEVRRDVQRGTMEVPADVEAAILAVLRRPLEPDETHLAGGVHREQALREIFSQLSATQALALGKRLDINADANSLAVAFRRLTVERRQRLRSYLAEVRRRIALLAPGRSASERS